MHHLIGAVLVGVVAGGATGNRVRFRSGVRRLVQGGILAKRRIEALAASVREDAEKIVDEARADLDNRGTERPR